MDFVELVTAAVLEGISATVGLLPHSVQRRIGKAAGWMLQRVLPQRWEVTVANLQRAFPEKSAEWHQSIAQKSFENLGIVFAELLAMPHYSESHLRRLVRFRQTGLIEQAQQRGRGLVLLSAHYGNWELSALALPLVTTVPVTVVTKRVKNAVVDQLLDRARRRTGNQLVRAHRVGRSIPRIIRENRALALLADQSARPQHDFYVPFFGIPTLTFRTPAVLALRFQMPVIVGFCERQPDGSYEVVLQTLPTEDLLPVEEGAQELMRRYHQLLEAAIRRHPEQWLWQHRRWKHTPKEALASTVAAL